MKRCFILIAFSMMIFLLSCAPSNKPESEIKGGKIDNSYITQETINSTNIDSFNTFFYLTDSLHEEISGSYSFSIEHNDQDEYVLTEDAHYKISETIDKAVVDELQKIITRNNLIELNGVDEQTMGLPEEFAPCMMSVIYDSGEKLYFSTDNNPDAAWAKEIKELFQQAFIELGHEELLPAKENRSLVRFDLGYTDGAYDYKYFTVFTDEDTGDYSVHYMKNVYNRELKDVEYDNVIEVPDDFYSELNDFISGQNLDTFENGLIEPGGTSNMDKYAFYSMELDDGSQINAFYEGAEADDLYEALCTTSEYIDKYFE